MSELLKAGAGKVPIDLDGVLPFDGFDSVRHDLCCRALVIEGVGTRICILTIEMTSIAPNLLSLLIRVAMEKTGCADTGVWVVPTHTFSAPHVRTPSHLANDDERLRNERYLSAVLDAAATACSMAMDSMSYVKLGISMGCCSINVNRDVETPAGWWLGTVGAGYADHAMPTIVLARPDASVAAVIATADVQSSVLDKSVDSNGDRLVTGDLFGFAAQAVERELGCVALLMPGAAGDQSPREKAVSESFDRDDTRVVHDAHEDGYRMLHRQGSELARALLEAIHAAAFGAREKADGSQVLVESGSFSVSLPAQQRADFHSLAPRRSYEFKRAGETETRASLMRLGECVLVGVQPEVSSSFGTSVREVLPGRVLLATLVNGGAKYLPASDAYEKITYEAMNSGFAQGAHEKLLKEISDAVTAASR